MLLKSKEIAYLGVLLALNQIFIFLSSIVKTNTLALFSLAALMVGIVIVEFGVKNGVLFYIASSILGFFLTTSKVEIVTYILFFGLYSIVKYAVEKTAFQMRSAKLFEMATKLLFFNLIALSIYFILKGFVNIRLYWWLIIIAELAFIAYDYAFSILINYYITKIQPKIKTK